MFLRTFAPKVPATTVPTAHVLFYDGTLQHDAPLVAMTEVDLADAVSDGTLCIESELVRWLLKQVKTYDPYRGERVVGLVFDKETVLSDVVRRPVTGPGDTQCRPAPTPA